MLFLINCFLSKISFFNFWWNNVLLKFFNPWRLQISFEAKNIFNIEKRWIMNSLDIFIKILFRVGKVKFKNVNPTFLSQTVQNLFNLTFVYISKLTDFKINLRNSFFWKFEFIFLSQSWVRNWVINHYLWFFVNSNSMVSKITKI